VIAGVGHVEVAITVGRQASGGIKTGGRADAVGGARLSGLAGEDATPASMAQLLGALREIGRLGR
jgi:hypothetical protein